MRTPGEQVAGQPPLELVGVGAFGPGHPGHQLRLARIGQHAGPRDVSHGPQGQPDAEQRRAAADHHLAAVGIGHSQLPLAVGVDADLTLVVAEPPRLRVVHRRGMHRRADHEPRDLLRGTRLAGQAPRRRFKNIHGLVLDHRSLAPQLFLPVRAIAPTAGASVSQSPMVTTIDVR